MLRFYILPRLDTHSLRSVKFSDTFQEERMPTSALFSVFCIFIRILRTSRVSRLLRGAPEQVDKRSTFYQAGSANNLPISMASLRSGIGRNSGAGRHRLQIKNPIQNAGRRDMQGWEYPLNCHPWHPLPQLLSRTRAGLGTP